MVRKSTNQIKDAIYFTYCQFIFFFEMGPVEPNPLVPQQQQLPPQKLKRRSRSNERLSRENSRQKSRRNSRSRSGDRESSSSSSGSL